MAQMFDPDFLPAPRPPAAWRAAMLAATIVMALAVAGMWVASEYRRVEAGRDTFERSYQRRVLIADLMSELKDAETGQRGYLITGNPDYLEPYRSAGVQIADRKRRIEAVLIAVPRQTMRYRQLARLIDRRMAELQAVLTVKTQQGASDARRTMHRDGGNVVMTEARAVADAMMLEEDHIIAMRHARLAMRSSTVQQWVWILVLTLAALFCAGLALAWAAGETQYRLQIQTQEAIARLRAVFAGTSDGIALIDAGGMIEAVNPAVTAMLGHVPGALIGRDIAVLIDVLPAGGALETRLGLIDGHLAEPLRLDRVAHHAAGHSVPIDVALGLMPMPSGLHLVAAIHDISDRKVVDRIKDEFVATVSHELRTPLTSIVGALGLLRATADETLSAGARRLVQVAEENSRRLIVLVNDLLDMERMEAGGLRFRTLPVDLAQVLAQVVEGNEGLATAKGVRIALALAPGGIPVRGDAGRLAQVATNLLANAIRFSPRGQVVTITGERRDGRGVVTIEDRGPGVPEDFRDRLFTRFAQSEETGPAGGTGLGLAISRQIMRAHGGVIGFAPRAGGGASFHFSIELRSTEAEPPHLLICAVVPAVAQELRMRAEAGGCTADRVNSVADAQAALRTGAYDALLVCLDGRGDSGLRLLAILNGAAIDGRLSIPVVARIDGAMQAGSTVDRSRWHIVAGHGAGLAERIRALRADLYRDKPLILHVDGDGATMDRTAAALGRRARVRRARDLAGAMAIVLRETPAIVILEQEMADADTDALIDRLAGLDGGPVTTILYAAGPVPPALERRVDMVVTRSARSSPNLIGAVDRALARTGDDRAVSAA